MSNSAENKTNNSVVKKIFNVLFYVVISIIIVVSALYTVATFSTKNGVTSIFGYIISSVQTGSMSGTFEAGDVIFTKKVDPADIKVGDVVSFYYQEPQTSKIIIVTHRVNEIREDGKFVTQGDVAKRENSVDQIEIVSSGDIIARYEGFKISGLGKVTDFLRSKVGFFVCILIPVFLFLFWQIFVFAKTLSDAKNLSKEKAINDEARALAEQMVKQMQQEAADNNVSDTSEKD